MVCVVCVFLAKDKKNSGAAFPATILQPTRLPTTTTTTMMWLWWYHTLLGSFAAGWVVTPRNGSPRATQTTSRVLLRRSSHHDASNDPGWSVADDWESLSQAENPVLDGSDIFHYDLAARAAQRLQQQPPEPELSEAEAWLHRSIGRILNPHDDDDDNDHDDVNENQYDGMFNNSNNYNNITDDTSSQWEQHAAEVARLVRCQQVPEALLVATGRAVPALSWDAAHDVRQLLVWNTTTRWWQATDFLHDAVSTLFATHLTQANDTTITTTTTTTTNSWDAAAVASWMRQSLQEPCGKHDARVQTVLSQFGRCGHVDCDGLERLYVQALVGEAPKHTATLSPVQVERALDRFMQQPSLQAVWRDLERHGIASPAQTAQAVQIQAVEAAAQSSSTDQPPHVTEISSDTIIMDECEILDDGAADGWYQDDVTGVWEYRGKSSHQKVLLASDGKTPLFLEDGDYVFIDEESCIGCTQCALAAPASFQMLDNGRARTFVQRGRITDVQAAVKTCPVNCMHYVDFARLTKLEQARDSVNGDDGRTDHRHFGRDRRHDKWRLHTPLHVSRMESSDANHKDSLYHYVRRQCYQSNQCPQKGCYDCPLYASDPEANPYLKQRRQESNHIRAQTFVDDGSADRYRRTADL